MQTSRFEMRSDGVMVVKQKPKLLLRMKHERCAEFTDVRGTDMQALRGMQDQLAALDYELVSLGPA